MDRTRSYKNQELEEKPEFIERSIIIGLVTNMEYAKEVLKIDNPVQYFAANSAKHIARWIIEYFNKYGKSPYKDMEGIWVQKCKEENLPGDIAQDIEDILSGLSDQTEKTGIDPYLFDQTIQYFKERQAEMHLEQMQAAHAAGDMDEFNRLLTKFKPIQIESKTETGFNAWEATQMELKPVEWLIENLLPKGLTVFAGQSKLGKSYLMLNMMIHLVKDEWMFSEESTSGYRGPQGQVLYLALEDTQSRIIKRLHDIDPNPDRKLRHLNIELQWKSLTDGGLADLENWIKSKSKPRLIVIDVMAKVWGMKAGTSGGRQYTEEYREWGPLADLAHKYNISIVAITHSKKGKESDVFNEILGGAGTQGPADNLMVLSRHPKNHEQRVLAIRGKDVEEMHLVFDVTDEGAGWYCLGEMDEVQKTTERQSICNYLNAAGPKTFDGIKQAAKDGEIEVSANSVNTILRKMVTDGALEQDKRRGMYMIAGTRSQMVNMRLAEKLKKHDT